MAIELDKLNSLVRKVYTEYFLPANLDIPEDMLLLDTVLSLSLVGCSARLQIDWRGNRIFPNMFVIKIARSGIGKDRPLAFAENDLLSGFIDRVKHQYWDFMADYREKPYDYIEPYCYKGLGARTTFENLELSTQKLLTDRYSPYDFQFHFESATLEGLVAQAQSMRMFGKGVIFCKNSEFGAFMNSTSDSKQDFLIGLQKGYDVQPFGGKIIKSSRQIETVKGIPIVFLGHTTDDWIKTEADKELVMKFIRGGIGRRSFLYYPRDYDLEVVDIATRSAGVREAKDNAFLLAVELEQLYMRGLKSDCITFSEHAEMVAQEYEMDLNIQVAKLINSNSTSAVAELKGRFMKSVRLMGLFAFLDGRTVIEQNHAEQAIYLTNYFAKFASDFFLDQELSIGEKYAHFLINHAHQEIPKTTLAKLGYLPYHYFRQNFKHELETIEYELNEQNYELITRQKGKTTVYTAKEIELSDLNEIPLMVNLNTHGKTNDRLAKYVDYTEIKSRWNELYEICKTYAYMPQLVSGSRAKKNFKPGGQLLGLDFDDGLSLEKATKLLTEFGLESLLITTKSHTRENHRFRVLIPLKSPYTGSQDQWKGMYTNFSKELGSKNDPACSDVSRFYFPSPANATHIYVKGKSLDWRDYMPVEKRYVKKNFTIDKPVEHALDYVKNTYGVISKGQRDEVLNNVYHYYKSEQGLPLGVVSQIVREVNSRCLSEPFSESYLTKWERDR